MPFGPLATGGGAAGAPTDAQYVVLAANATLTQERILTGSANEIVVTDGGAGGNVTLTAGPLIVQTDQANTWTVGSQIIQTNPDTVTAFQVLDAAAAPVLSVDTINERVGLGTAAPDSRLHALDSVSYRADFQVTNTDTRVLLEIKNNPSSCYIQQGAYGNTYPGSVSGLPLARAARMVGNGDNVIYGNRANSPVVFIANDAEKARITADGTFQVNGFGAAVVGVVVKAAAAQTANLFEGQLSDATIVNSIGATGDVLIQPSTDSLTALQVLDADGGVPVLSVDTINERVGIGTAAPGYPLHVVGPVGNATSDIPLTFERQTATTNALVSSMRGIAVCTGNMVEGFGPRFRFEIEDGAAGPNLIGSFGFRRGLSDTAGSFEMTSGANGTTVMMTIAENGQTNFYNTTSLGITVESSAASGAAAGTGVIAASNDGAVLANGDRLGIFLFAGSRTAADLAYGGGMIGYAAENWVNGAAYGTDLQFHTVSLGSTARTNKLTIGASGNVLVNGFISTVVGLTVKAAAAQTANLIEAQDSAGNVGFEVQADFDVVIGSGAAAKDYTLTFNGENSDGVLRWMEDEDRFESDDEVKFLDRIVTNTATLSAVGPTDNQDASGVNILFIDASGNNVTLGGWINGVSGQIMHIVVTGINAATTVTVEHAEGTGNQDMYLSSGADESLANSYGGWTLVCDGSNWYEVEQ